MRILTLAFSLLLASSLSAFAAGTDWGAVEKVLGRKGTVQGDVIKVTFPRGDLKVNVKGVRALPGLALTSWVAFHAEGNSTAIMGDLVLTGDEVAPVMASLESAGIWVTALHNHLLGERPRVMYMHFGGRGEAVRLAGAMMDVLRLTGTPLEGKAPKPGAGREKRLPEKPDWSGVESVLGKNGQGKGMILSYSFPRAEAVTEMGVVIPPSMGVATAVNFQAEGKKAAAAGDFVLTADEVNPVINALIAHGIAVTAVHNHMLFESPRLFFLHFWGYDEPGRLAEGIKAALLNVNIER